MVEGGAQHPLFDQVLPVILGQSGLRTPGLQNCPLMEMLFSHGLNKGVRCPREEMLLSGYLEDH